MGNSDPVLNLASLSRIEKLALGGPVAVAACGVLLALFGSGIGSLDSNVLGNVGEWFAGAAAMAAVAVLLLHRVEDADAARGQSEFARRERWRSDRLEALATVSVLQSLYRYDAVPAEAFGPIHRARSEHSAKLVSYLASSGMSAELKRLVEAHLQLIIVHEDSATMRNHDPRYQDRKTRLGKVRRGLDEMAVLIAGELPPSGSEQALR